MARLKDLQLGSTRRKAFAWTKKRADGSSLECKVAIQILTGHQMDLAMAQAVEYVRALRAGHRPTKSEALELDPALDRELVETARQYEVLAIAVRDADNPDGMPWASADELRKLLTQDDVATLWKAYEAHQDEQGPVVRELSAEQVDALTRALVEEADSDPLLVLAYRLRLNFTRTLAVRLTLSQTANSLLSSQLEALQSELKKTPQIADTSSEP